MREWLNRNSAMVTVVAVVVLVAALGLVVWNMSSGRSGGAAQAYFFDPNTQQLIPADAMKAPPFQVSTGPEQAVGAVVYACGEGACGSEKSRQIGFLWRYTPKGLELAQQIASMGNTQDDLERRGLLAPQLELEKQYRKPDSDKWLNANTPETDQLLGTVYTACPSSKKAEICAP